MDTPIGSSQTSENEETACWISNDFPVLSDGNIFTCGDGSSRGGDSNKYSAMWKDGEGVNSGEHYWKIRFDCFRGAAFVQITNDENFAQGIFYGDDFGCVAKPGKTTEVFVTFLSRRLRVYFGYNGQPLELAFEIDKAALTNIRPAVQFYGTGRATIEKETELPPPVVKHSSSLFLTGIEGSWKIGTAASISFAGEYYKGYKDDKGNYVASKEHLATFTLSPLKKVAEYRVSLKIVNKISFVIKICDGFWRGAGIMSTQKWSYPDHMLLEKQLSSLIHNPDSFIYDGDQLTLQKGELIVKFVR